LQAEIRQPGTLSLFIPICETSDKPGSYLLVPKDSKITSTKQLKGKKLVLILAQAKKLMLKLY